jgi:hypothetical protein
MLTAGKKRRRVRDKKVERKTGCRKSKRKRGVSEDEASGLLARVTNEQKVIMAAWIQDFSGTKNLSGKELEGRNIRWPGEGTLG